MINDQEALSRIARSVGHYLDRCITRGEALEDVIGSLEASGHLGDAADMAETRSWAPTGKARSAKAKAPAGAGRRQHPDVRPHA